MLWPDEKRRWQGWAHFTKISAQYMKVKIDCCHTVDTFRVFLQYNNVEEVLSVDKTLGNIKRSDGRLTCPDTYGQWKLV